MSKIYVGRSLNNLKKSPQFAPYSRVTVIVNDDTKYTAGDDTGETLTVKSPWGNQEVANNLLKKFKGWQYQPYEADGASLNPAVELGDGVTVARIYSGLYSENLKFGRIPKSNFEAPNMKRLNHEIPFIPKKERETKRVYKQFESEITVQANLIAAEVKARTSEDAALSGRIDVTADQIKAEVKARTEANNEIFAVLEVQASEISAKVSQSGGDPKSFSWSLLPTGMNWYANGSPILELSAKGAKYHGDIEAENGFFHGTVRAGKILSGGENGTFDGSGITGGTVTDYEIADRTITSGSIQLDTITHSEIAASTLGTSVFQSGVTTSLGYADTANAVLFGATHCAGLIANGTVSGNTVNASTTFQFKGYTCTWKQVNGIYVIGRI